MPFCENEPSIRRRAASPRVERLTTVTRLGTEIVRRLLRLRSIGYDLSVIGSMRDVRNGMEWRRETGRVRFEFLLQGSDPSTLGGESSADRQVFLHNYYIHLKGFLFKTVSMGGGMTTVVRLTE